MSHLLIVGLIIGAARWLCSLLLIIGIMVELLLVFLKLLCLFVGLISWAWL